MWRPGKYAGCDRGRLGVPVTDLPVENKLTPLEIADARGAAYRASELQRGVEDGIRQASRDLADAERAYRMELATRITELHAAGVAWTVCESLAKGDPEVAARRHERDIKRGLLEATQQQAYRYAADRRDLAAMIRWSMHRDLRTDTPPVGWDDFDPQTGEITARRVS